MHVPFPGKIGFRLGDLRRGKDTVVDEHLGKTLAAAALCTIVVSDVRVEPAVERKTFRLCRMHGI